MIVNPFMTSGLITPTCYWKCNDGSGSTASDSVGSSSGTLTNGASFSSDYVLLDGTNDYVDLPINSDRFTSATAGTICAWVYPTSWGSSNAMIYTEDTGVSATSRLYIGYGTDGAPRFVMRDGSRSPSGSALVLAGSAGGVPLNTWTFLAGGFDTATETRMLLVNSAIVASTTADSLTAMTATAPLYTSLGGLRSGTGGTTITNTVTGRIKGVRAYKYLLSAAELYLIFAGVA